MLSHFSVGLLRRSKFLLALPVVALATVPRSAPAQTYGSQAIKVESREVVLPVIVIKESKDPKGLLISPNGESYPVWMARSEEITGLSTKSVHLFEDGVEQKIEHFSVETVSDWLINDNTGQHIEYSWTPKGIWSGSDKRKIEFEPRLHTYLLTYVPPPSPRDSCHRVSVRVDRKHATILAPDQYCNTKDPLSDPLKDTQLGSKLLEFATSLGNGSLPLTAQLVPFVTDFGAYRVNLAASVPAHLLDREWEGNHLHTSIAVLCLVYDKNHVLVARFSDTACLSPGCNVWYNGALPPTKGDVLPPIAETRKYGEDLVVPTAYRTQLALGPGTYRVELATTDGVHFGRAVTSVIVDDFSENQLAISGLALCKRYHTPAADERGPTRAPQYVPLMFDGQEFTPTGDTHFKKGEQLMTYAEIYSAQLGSMPPPEFFLEMKVADTKTGELKIGTGPRPLKSSAKVGNTIPMVWTMEIEKLPPGTYRLEAQASDSAGHKTEWRTASFSVQ